MNKLIDILPLVHLIVNLTEVVVHKAEKVRAKFVKLINSYLSVENALKSEECKNKVVENKFFLACNHFLTAALFTPWPSQIASHQGKPGRGQSLLLVKFNSYFLKVVDKTLL